MSDAACPELVEGPHPENRVAKIANSFSSASQKRDLFAQLLPFYSHQIFPPTS